MTERPDTRSIVTQLLTYCNADCASGHAARLAAIEWLSGQGDAGAAAGPVWQDWSGTRSGGSAGPLMLDSGPVTARLANGETRVVLPGQPFRWDKRGLSTDVVMIAAGEHTDG